MSIFLFAAKLHANSDPEERIRWEGLVHDALTRIQFGTIPVAPGSVGAGAEVVEIVAAQGLVAGMMLKVTPAPGFPAGLDFVESTSDNQIVISFRNRTGAPINPGSMTWAYFAMRVI